MAVIAIMVLVGIIVATGIPAAHRAYVAAVDASNAQILVSTTTTRLRDVLSMADPSEEIEAYENPAQTTSGGSVYTKYATFVSLDTGYTTQILYHDATNGYPAEGLYIDSWVGDENETPAPTKIHMLLVPSKAGNGASAGLKADVDKITYDPNTGLFTVTNLQVKQSDGTALERASVESFEVKVIAA